MFSLLNKKPSQSRGGFFIPTLEAKLRCYSIHAMKFAEYVYQKPLLAQHIQLLAAVDLEG